MQTEEQLSELINHTAKIRITNNPALAPCNISPWPFPNVLFVDSNFLEKAEAEGMTSTELQEIMFKALVLRSPKYWYLSVGMITGLLFPVGLVMAVIFLMLNIFGSLSINWLWADIVLTGIDLVIYSDGVFRYGSLRASLRQKGDPLTPH